MPERTELFTFGFPDKTDWKIIKELIESVDLDLKNNPIEGLKFSHRQFNKKLRQAGVEMRLNVFTFLFTFSFVFTCIHVLKIYKVLILLDYW